MRGRRRGLNHFCVKLILIIMLQNDQKLYQTDTQSESKNTFTVNLTQKWVKFTSNSITVIVKTYDVDALFCIYRLEVILNPQLL